MAIRTSTELKKLFGPHQKPTGADFSDLIDSCLNEILRKALTSNIQLSAGDLQTIISTVQSTLTAGDIVKNTLYDSMVNMVEEHMGHTGVSQDVLFGGNVLTITNGLVTAVTAYVPPVQTATPTPTPTITITKPQPFKGKWENKTYNKGDEVCWVGRLWIAGSVQTDPNDVPGSSIHWIDMGPDTRCPAVTPSATPSPTPTPTPTPTFDAFKRHKGTWLAQGYMRNSYVCYDNQLWRAANQTESDDVPGTSVHWLYIHDEVCETPTPTPTLTPTPTPTDKFKATWQPRVYSKGSNVCWLGYLWEASSGGGADAADIPGTSIHWTNIGIDSRCPPVTPTPTPTPTPTITGPTPTPTPTPTDDVRERIVGLWQAIYYPYTKIVIHDGYYWRADKPSGCEFDDEPGKSVHWTMVREEEAVSFNACYPTPTATPTPTPTPSPTPTPTPTTTYPLVRNKRP